MNIQEMDVIRLKDGQIGTVMNAYKDSRFFTVDIESSDGQWELHDVSEDRIDRVLWRSK